MTTSRFGKKLLKVGSILLIVFALLATGFHYWFKAHARQLIEDMVETRSHGKLKLKVHHFSFNWFSKKMEFRDAEFYSTDSSTANTIYRFHVDRIRLKVEAILPIVFKKRFIIDTLTLQDPDITVTRLKSVEHDDKSPARDISIPEEMGKIYNSIQDALQVLKVSRFQIQNGKFTLVNRIQEDQRPITIGNLDFRIDNLQVDTTIRGSREKILFSDNVILHSQNQDILFPDQRHRLSFSQFNINLQQKLVSFDSCTIAAARTDSSSASFTIFMDALKLIDIDFDTLYKHEVIKADSVYCVNPTFDLDVDMSKKKGAKQTPKLENIIQQLTGDLQLDNVVVTNAGFNIKTIRDSIPTSFTFRNNSFDMQGLTVDQEAKDPVKVKSFAMAIRNYENFIKDSSYRVQFDSVLFRDDRIYLNNFVFHKLDNRGRIINTFNIPQFYLGGLSWDALVFDKKLKAEQATLYSPTIDYTVSSQLNKKKGKQNLFHSLGEINDLMDLGNLDIVDGDIKVKVNKQLQIDLKRATLSIQSHDLLSSTKLAGIKNSLTRLDFDKGEIRAGSLLLKLDRINYVGESGKFDAGRLSVTDATKKTFITLDNIKVNQMLVNEITGDIYSDGITWDKANIDLTTGGGKKEPGSMIELNNVHGRNTKLSGRFGQNRVSSFFSDLTFSSLDKKPGQKLKLEGFTSAGQDLKVENAGIRTSATKFSINDLRESSLYNFDFRKNNERGSASIRASSFRFVPNLAAIMASRLEAKELILNDADISIQNPGKTADSKPMPYLDFDLVKLVRPKVDYTTETAKGPLHIQWNSSDPSTMLELQSLHHDKAADAPLKIGKAKINVRDMAIAIPGGRMIESGNGKLDAELQAISIGQANNKEISANVTRLLVKDLVLDSIDKNNGRLAVQNLLLRGLGIHTGTMSSLQSFMKANGSFLLDDFNGYYTGSKAHYTWHNLSMDRSAALFSMDSIRFEPAESRDSFMSRQSFQADYIAWHSGKIRMKGFDIAEFLRSRAVNANELEVSNAVFTDYRDNRLPFQKGKMKPMPVGIFRSLPVPLKIDQAIFHNGRVEYTQVGERTKLAGLIPVTAMEVRINNMKNHDYNGNDSLTVYAEGKLMDTAWLSLQVKQSYNDSLGGFQMKTTFSKADLRIFNEALIPLASAMIKSGGLDTATLLAYGNNELAWGKMKMYYHDLSFRLLKNSDENQKSFIKGLLSFVANAFFIKNKNDHRVGNVFFVREPDRSAINFLIRIAMSGFTSSIGVKGNRKLEKAYRAALKERNMQPLPVVPDKF